ncbi:hypothetical protein ACO0SA_003153 [Hanseniaspora valbyensis]
MYKGNGAVAYQGLIKSYFDIPEQIDDDTFRIMITTDNHIGYKENDPYVELDSYNNFKEVLQICNNLGNVDFMLNSGDLFHDNYFSSKNLNFITDLLVNTCLNDAPITFKTEHKPDYLNLNYDDENINVGLPIFIINGNHDYGNSIGTENVSILKILSNLKLINYLGNFNIVDNEDVEVEPVILKKGTTQLNLYGLSNIKEERLNKLIRNNRLSFLTNDEVTPKGLNLLLLHQNRSSNINKTFLNENLLPDFLDLLIWGHEHECIPDLAYNSLKNFNILQPGSTVQTSFHESELKPKSCFLMDFKDNKYTIYPIPLETVRPMKVRSLSLKDINVPKDLEQITKVVVNEVEEMLQEVESDRFERELEAKKRTTNNYINNNNESFLNVSNNSNVEEEDEFKKDKLLPLIRLKLDYTGYEDMSFRSINNRFMGKVANPGTVLQLSKTYVRKYKHEANNILQKSLNNNGSKESENETKNNKLSTNDQLVAIIKKSFTDDNKLIALNEKNLVDFFSNNLSNSIAESKINMNKFIKKEAARATQALVESTKNEINDLFVKNLTEDQDAVNEQPLLTGTKDYKKLLKNVSSLLNKKLKSEPSVPVKRNLDEKENADILLSPPGNSIEIMGNGIVNNDISEGVIVSKPEQDEKMDNPEVAPNEYTKAASIELPQKIIKKPKINKRILSSDSEDDDFIINSDNEGTDNKMIPVRNATSMINADIIQSQISISKSNSILSEENNIHNKHSLNTNKENKSMNVTNNGNSQIIVSSSDDDIEIIEENIAKKTVSVKEQSTFDNSQVWESEVNQLPILNNKKEISSLERKSFKEISRKPSIQQDKTKPVPVRRGPPVRKAKMHVKLLSSDSDDDM